MVDGDRDRRQGRFGFDDEQRRVAHDDLAGLSVVGTTDRADGHDVASVIALHLNRDLRRGPRVNVAGLIDLVDRVDIALGKQAG